MPNFWMERLANGVGTLFYWPCSGRYNSRRSNHLFGEGTSEGAVSTGPLRFARPTYARRCLGADHSERATRQNADGEEEQAADAVQDGFKASSGGHSRSPLFDQSLQGELEAVPRRGPGGAGHRPIWTPLRYALFKRCQDDLYGVRIKS